MADQKSQSRMRAEAEFTKVQRRAVADDKLKTERESEASAAEAKKIARRRALRWAARRREWAV